MNEQPNNVIPMPAAQPAPAKFIVTAVIDGFTVQVEMSGKASDLRTLLNKLKEFGAVPSATKPAAAASADDGPICEFHGKMKKGNYGWFCPKKMGNGEYCKSKS
jgi:hypothetical protein